MPKSHKEPHKHQLDVTCPSCNVRYVLIPPKSGQTPLYCPYCKALLNRSAETTEQTIPPSGLSSGEGPVTLIQEHIPEEAKIQFSIGPYHVLDSIGKGGMGEVFLAYDTTCGRRIALKRIRPDLLKHTQMHNRFLREARLTSQLTHPAIIPIYTIQSENELVYYTMPFVEGSTLKQILSSTKKQVRKGGKPEHLGGSIPSLIRIYLSVCQAVAYAHSKNVLHRDLKPDNIIVGPYGEVSILDWGLAKLTSEPHGTESKRIDEAQLEEEFHPEQDITRIGKVVGTIPYMAPERALGQPATYRTDIYALGVILYQILTLRHPFNRRSLKDFRKNLSHEVLHDPAEVAPYRDVPPILSRIALKCLTPVIEERYKSVDELIHDLENYIEGRSEWFKISELDIHNKSDWEFQENVLIAEHMAITRVTEVSDWVSLMISKASYAENTKIEAKVRIGEKGHGIGFLLSVPEAAERFHLNNGYCLWVASDRNTSTKLLRATVEVLQAPEVFLQRNEWVQVRIEKIDNNIYFYLNDVLQFSYISHLPLTGTHLGLLARDADFTIQEFVVYAGSQNIKVNCLAVPDAFLSHKIYAAALSEYRRIGYSFPGTAEGREAMFRAGVTLLEEARNSSDPEFKNLKFEEALDEFSKLHRTPGAPLEYLGKALVYQTLEDYEEEAKCFELALRRYLHHPLLPVLQEQLIYRMHDSSRYHRKATYDFVLIAARYLSATEEGSNIRKLLDRLKRHWEPLYFLEPTSPDLSDHLQDLNIAIPLAFWLAKPYILVDIIEEVSEMESPDTLTICNALFSLLELGAWKIARKILDDLYIKTAQYEIGRDERRQSLELLKVDTLYHTASWNECIEALFAILPQQLGIQEIRVVLYLMDRAISTQRTALVHEIVSRIKQHSLLSETHLMIDCYQIWAYLLDKDWNAAGNLLQSYPLEQLTQETTPLHFLYGCWLEVTEGKEIASIHFSSILEVAYPRSWTLFSHFIKSKNGEKQQWLQRAFLWEKRQLYRQYALFYRCAGNDKAADEYTKLEQQEYTDYNE